MIADALRYPVSGDRPRRTVVIGLLLSALGVFVIPMVLAVGYIGRVLDSSSRGESVPSFENWDDLFENGLLSGFVLVCYAGISVACFAVIGLFSLFLGEIGFGGAFVGVLFFVFLSLFFLTVALPVLVFLPALVTHFVRERRLRAALDWGTIRSVSFDTRYLCRWFVGCCFVGTGSVVYTLLGGTIAMGVLLGDYGDSTLVSAVQSIGHLVGAGINFYCQVAAAYCFGRGYAMATGRPVTDEQHRPIRIESEPIGIEPNRRRIEERRNENRRMDEGEKDDRKVVAGGIDERPEWGAEAAAWREQRRRSRRSENGE
ncbi:Protein of unknown function [Haladaptatus litoreus]|uniref:Membrane domain of glycerophosphoryl diester phosphodiesterase n=1 Tax=Haladaptatus litoreus TaxID=553468 RepID=A0A1N6Z650_9EURY|nr:DUF4013 domain-containing protein [Haladaptatus litoreus]SIR22256.1 Protein of unknown function [Haladaptatus litoreus]